MTKEAVEAGTKILTSLDGQSLAILISVIFVLFVLLYVLVYKMVWTLIKSKTSEKIVCPNEINLDIVKDLDYEFEGVKEKIGSIENLSQTSVIQLSELVGELKAFVQVALALNKREQEREKHNTDNLIE